MPRIFITGSTDGLGRAAAGVLMGEGHEVVLHARTSERAATLSDLVPAAAGVVIGDLSSAAQTREAADQVNDIGRCHAAGPGRLGQAAYRAMPDHTVGKIQGLGGLQRGSGHNSVSRAGPAAHRRRSPPINR